jgi:beta-galactosidase GanA
VTKARRSSSVSRITYQKQTSDTAYSTTELAGQKLKISGIGQEFDGIFTITGQGGSGNTRYIQYSQSGKPNVSEFETDGEITKDYGYIAMSGTIPSSPVDPAGQARVAGTLPFRAASGTAAVSTLIERQQSGGNIIKENNVIFTPGLIGATGVIDADVLEIDTKNREVAFNGEVEGARGRIDVLADFIQLAPGQNEIEFEDVGNPEGSALLRIFYRSGWLA